MLARRELGLRFLTRTDSMRSSAMEATAQDHTPPQRGSWNPVGEGVNHAAASQGAELQRADTRPPRLPWEDGITLHRARPYPHRGTPQERLTRLDRRRRRSQVCLPLVGSGQPLPQLLQAESDQNVVSAVILIPATRRIVAQVPQPRASHVEDLLLKAELRLLTFQCHVRNRRPVR